MNSRTARADAEQVFISTLQSTAFCINAGCRVIIAAQARRELQRKSFNEISRTKPTRRAFAVTVQHRRRAAWPSTAAAGLLALEVTHKLPLHGHPHGTLRVFAGGSPFW